MAMDGSLMAEAVSAASISLKTRCFGFSAMSATVARSVMSSLSLIRPVASSMRSARASLTTSFMIAMPSPSLTSSSEVYFWE